MVEPVASTSTSRISSFVVSAFSGGSVPVRKMPTFAPGRMNEPTRAVSLRLTEIAIIPSGIGRVVSASTSSAPPNFSAISCSPG